MVKKHKVLGILILIYSVVITLLINLGVLTIEQIVFGLSFLIALILVWAVIYLIIRYNSKSGVE